MSKPARRAGLWALAKTIAIEELYQGIRGRAEFQTGSQTQGAKALRRNAIATPIAQLALFGTISAVFGFGALLELEQGAGGPAVVRGSFLLLFIFEFLIALMTTAQTMATALDLGLLEPVRTFPLTDRLVRRAASLAWLLPQGSGALALVLPAAGMVAAKTGSPGLFLMALWWGGVFLILGHLVGLLSASFLKASGSGQRKSVLGTLRRFVGILSAFLVIALWQVIFQLQEPLADLTRPLGGSVEALWPFFPFTAFSAMAASVEGAVPAALMLLSGAYGVAFFVLYERGAARFWRVAFEPPLPPGPPRRLERYRPTRLATRNPVLGLAAKDLRLIFRKPNVAVMLFIPLVLVIPFLFAPQADQGGNGGEPPQLLEELGWAIVGLQLAGIAAIGLSLSPTVFLIAEGKSAWVLRALPFSTRTIIWGKTLAAAIPFACYFPILGWLIAAEGGLDPAQTLLLLAMLGSSAVSIALVSMRLLLRRVPQDALTFTQDTFGRLIGMFLLVVGVAIAMLPIGVGAVVTLLGFGRYTGEGVGLAVALAVSGVIVATLPSRERRARPLPATS